MHYLIRTLVTSRRQVRGVAEREAGRSPCALLQPSFTLYSLHWRGFRFRCSCPTPVQMSYLCNVSQIVGLVCKCSRFSWPIIKGSRVLTVIRYRESRGARSAEEEIPRAGGADGTKGGHELNGGNFTSKSNSTRVDSCFHNIYFYYLSYSPP